MSASPTVRPFGPEDLDWVLSLNRIHEEALSPLDGNGLKRLAGEALMILAAPDQAGFVICFDQDAAYDSPNFLWFRAKYDRFVYVDRIAVDATKGLSGVGSALYASVFCEAARRGYPVACAEVNTDPPNPVSLAFHAKRGFQSVGEARLAERGKSVRYLACQVGDGA